MMIKPSIQVVPEGVSPLSSKAIKNTAKTSVHDNTCILII